MHVLVVNMRNGGGREEGCWSDSRHDGLMHDDWSDRA